MSVSTEKHGYLSRVNEVKTTMIEKKPESRYAKEMREEEDVYTYLYCDYN